MIRKATEADLDAVIKIYDELHDAEKDAWEYKTEDNDVCVLHTLVISPQAGGKGYGKQFVKYYEDYALKLGCHELRLDTNERNDRAREMYRKLGYKEIGIVPTVFNGIPNVNLVLLEKRIITPSLCMLI